MSDTRRPVEPTPLRGDALHNLCLADAVWAERYDGWTTLGRGGSATVVRTFSRAAGNEVALKIFYGLTAEDWQRFHREVINAQRLASPHVVRTFSPFARGSLAWIEMELVKGRDLRAELEEAAARGVPVPLARALAIARAVASALVTAHAEDVIHRDLKPANVLLPENRRPIAKLGDFGISRIQGGTRVTATGLLTGTPQFAPPEVFGGQEAGPASDVYSLSLCLYLLFSNNRFPFDLPANAAATQWMGAHLHQTPRPLRAFADDLPPGLSTLLAQGLSKETAKRPTAAELLARLSEARADDPHLLTKPVRPRRRRALLLAFGLGAILGSASALTWMAPSLRSRRAPGAEATPASAVPAVPAPMPSAVTSPTPPPPSLPAARPALSPPSTLLTPRATPSTSHSPEATPTPSPSPLGRLPVRVQIEGSLVRLVNDGPDPLRGIRLVLVGRDGSRHAATAEELAPGEDLYLTVDAFTPPPSAGFRPSQAEVDALVSGAEERRRIFSLAPSGEPQSDS